MSPPSPHESITAPLPQRANPVQRHAPWLYAFWKFSRPHTIIGTSLSVVGLYGMAIALSAQAGEYSFPDVLRSLLATWFTCLCGNVYIVGLNQLEDIDIDRINKPHLPLASGEFSRRQGWGIVAVTGLLALVLAPWQGIFLTATVWLSLLIGTAYSLPPLRLKRFPFWASVCIFTVRGVIVNLGLFLHADQQLQVRAGQAVLQGMGGALWAIPAPVWALTLFVLVFTFAIAIFKDIPDLEGDRRYNITTFTVQLGRAAVFKLARGVLTVCYVGMVVAGGLLPAVNGLFIGVTHGLALAALWYFSVRVDLADKGAIARFYQFIWKLFFLEYLLFPVACFWR
ncbi:MAG: homogentisate phytyltransferase [Synechococcales bacterium]|nr:homogentisate phytyltransferase [Synechococcales bacterium]